MRITGNGIGFRGRPLRSDGRIRLIPKLAGAADVTAPLWLRSVSKAFRVGAAYLILPGNVLACRRVGLGSCRFRRPPEKPTTAKQADRNATIELIYEPPLSKLSDEPKLN